MLDYRLRVSRWARGISLRVTEDARLEVIAPRRIGARTIARVFRDHQDWITTTMQDARSHYHPSAPSVPAQVVLPAVARRWAITREPTSARGVRVIENPDALVLTGQITEPAACHRALRRWLAACACDHLPALLENTSRQHALPYGRCAVRLTRRQWGCCYRSGLISLSARLLFLPPAVVEYVLIHELSHTQEQNHSQNFWRIVARHCPEYKLRRLALRSLAENIPEWVVAR